MTIEDIHLHLYIIESIGAVISLALTSIALCIWAAYYGMDE